MLEQNVPLSEVSQLRFVRHHPNRCCIDPKHCPDRGDDLHRGAARFLAGLCSRRTLDGPLKILWLKGTTFDTTLLSMAWDRLYRRLLSGSPEGEPHGPVQADSVNAGALARAVLQLVLEENNTERLQLLTLFNSRAALIEACAVAIENDLGATGVLPR
jgi:hypothetical protein